MNDGYYSRKREIRTPKKTVVIICEGKTEKIYFDNFKIRGAGFVLHTFVCNKTDPLGLVDYAMDKAKEFDLNSIDDSVWCVCDFDEHSNQAVEKAKRLAGDSVRLILSNPSFELWYLLHFTNYFTPIDNRDLIDKLKLYLADYKKGVCVFRLVHPKISTAFNNSIGLCSIHEKKGVNLLSRQSNPHTKVHELVSYLMSL